MPAEDSRTSRRAVVSALASLPAASLVFGGYVGARASVKDTIAPPQGPNAGGDLASELRSHGGANLVGFRQPAPGAVPRTLLEKSGDIISVLDFGAVADGTSDSSAAFNKALATGKNVFVPAGVYAIASPIQIKFDGQTLFGHGTYTTELVWIGKDDKKNIIELRSGRREGESGATKSGMRFSGFKMSSAAGSACSSAIWVEAGVFHSEVSNIRLWPFFGTLAGAFVKLSSHKGDSYSVNCVFRDIVGTGIANGTNIPIPRGIWVESAIEALFERVVIYSVGHGWVLGAEDGNFDNIENCTFIRCHAEIGDRGNGRDDGAALLITGGSNLNFYACKFTSGINDQAGIPNVSDQVSIQFSSPDPTTVIRNVNFYGCNIWQLTQDSTPQARLPVVFDEDCVARDILFQGCRVNALNGFMSNLCDASVTERNTSYEAVIPPESGVSFQGRMGVTDTPTRMAANTVQTIAGPNEYSPFGLPVQASSTLSLSGTHLSWYKTTTTGLNVFSLWNPINGATVPFGTSRRFAMRHFQPQDIRARVCKQWDPGNAPANVGQTLLVACPGAQLGDFVKAGFVAPASGGMASNILNAWVSAAGVVSVRLFNPGSTKNFAAGRLTVYHLAPNFDVIETATYDPPSLVTLTATSTTVAVTGAALGDFVEVAFSLDRQNVIMWGEVTAADTVTVHLFNTGTGTIDLASGTLTVGVRNRHTSL
mgnify:CR=1 FL=1